MGVQVLPPQPDKFLDATAGYGTPQKAAHDLIMLKQYTVIGLLGRGSFGHVVKALDPSGQEVAIKLLPRGERIRGHRANVKREIVHQGSLKHPFIVGLKEVFLTHAHLAIVMECAQGGDLFKFLMGQPGNRLPEKEARRIFQQLVIGLDYCHCQGVANRDLKLENLLLSQDCSDGRRPLLKICDFGFSKHEANSGTAKTSVGTPIYMAPEVIYGSNRYDAKKADIWSCGVILYTLIYGCYPFNKEEKHYANKIVGAVYRLHPDVPASAGCLHLLRQLLVADPAERMPLAGIKQHPWFLEDLPDGALAMNDVFLMDHMKPKLEHHMQAINEVIDQGMLAGRKGEELPAVQLDSI